LLPGSDVHSFRNWHRHPAAYVPAELPGSLRCRTAAAAARRRRAELRDLPDSLQMTLDITARCLYSL